jgi:hypothetical protein
VALTDQIVAWLAFDSWKVRCRMARVWFWEGPWCVEYWRALSDPSEAADEF